MGVHHPYHLDLCADDEDPSQLIIRPGWNAPHVRCFPRTFCAWPCLLRQVGTVLGSPYDCVVARLAYANPGSRHLSSNFSAPQLARAHSGTDRQVQKSLFHESRTMLVSDGPLIRSGCRLHVGCNVGESRTEPNY